MNGVMLKRSRMRIVEEGEGAFNVVFLFASEEKGKLGARQKRKIGKKTKKCSSGGESPRDKGLRQRFAAWAVRIWCGTDVRVWTCKKGSFNGKRHRPTG